MKKISYCICALIFLSATRHAFAVESCTITIDTPVMNQTIGTSFTLSGSIASHNEATAMCAPWAVIPNSIGKLVVYDQNNLPVGTPIILNGPESTGYPAFAYAYPIHFSQTIVLERPISGVGKLVISDYLKNEEGEGREVSTKTVPIVFGNVTVETTSYMFTKTMTYGMKSNTDVQEMQKIFKRLGFFQLEPSGDFGPVTKQAVIMYQKYHGLPQVGVVGPLTKMWLTKDRAHN